MGTSEFELEVFELKSLRTYDIRLCLCHEQKEGRIDHIDNLNRRTSLPQFFASFYTEKYRSDNQKRNYSTQKVNVKELSIIVDVIICSRENCTVGNLHIL